MCVTKAGSGHGISAWRSPTCFWTRSGGRTLTQAGLDWRSIHRGATSIWLGGAKVNPELFLAYQLGWKSNLMVPSYLREQMNLDAEPARDVWRQSPN
jgi:hypothetical protein